MASPLPSVLIAGHSFVKRLHSDLQCKFDLRAAVDFNLVQTATIISWHQWVDPSAISQGIAASIC